jgi:GNAT superfamily N-acetyltransferase
MEIEEVDPGDHDAYAAQAHLVAEAVAVDCPWVTPPAHDDVPKRLLVGRERGSVVVRGSVDVDSRDDPDTAWVDVVVHPLCRREGRGTAMGDAVADLAGSLGRRTLRTSAWAETPGRRFVEARGFRHVSSTVHRRQHLPDLEPRQVDELHDGAGRIARGYELLRTVEDGEPGSGHRHLRLAARHRTSGRLVAHTAVMVDKAGSSAAAQHDTYVEPEHRGHRLGLWLKSGMVLWLREAHPQVTSVDTRNQESDHFLGAVNDMLGYRVLGRELVYER